MLIPKFVVISVKPNAMGDNWHCGLEKSTEVRRKICRPDKGEKRDLNVWLCGSCHTNFPCALSQWGISHFWSESCSCISKGRYDASKSTQKIDFLPWPLLRASMFLLLWNRRFREMELLKIKPVGWEMALCRAEQSDQHYSWTKRYHSRKKAGDHLASTWLG